MARGRTEGRRKAGHDRHWSRQLRRAIWVAICAVLVAVGLLASGCAEDAVQVELTETYVFPGFGFSIDHRAGWRAETRGTITHITELLEDQGDAPVSGYMVSLQHQSTGPMFQGFSGEPTLEDLLKLNIRFFQWEESLEASEAELFGVPALRVKTPERYGWASIAIGMVGGRRFFSRCSPRRNRRWTISCRCGTRCWRAPSLWSNRRPQPRAEGCGSRC